jgi:hypothetical protein
MITDTEILTHNTVDKDLFPHRSLKHALYKFFSTSEYRVMLRVFNETKKGHKNTLPYNQVHTVLKCWTACYL